MEKLNSYFDAIIDITIPTLEKQKSLEESEFLDANITIIFNDPQQQHAWNIKQNNKFDILARNYHTFRLNL